LREPQGPVPGSLCHHGNTINGKEEKKHITIPLLKTDIFISHPDQIISKLITTSLNLLVFDPVNKTDIFGLLFHQSKSIVFCSTSPQL